MELKVKMKVRLRKDLFYSKKRNLVVSSMLQYAGTTQTITKISTDRKYHGIWLKGYIWDAKDATPLLSKPKIQKPELFDPSNLNIKGS